MRTGRHFTRLYSQWFVLNIPHALNGALIYIQADVLDGVISIKAKKQGKICSLCIYLYVLFAGKS
jgi:hypothetical protein